MSGRFLECLRCGNHFDGDRLPLACGCGGPLIQRYPMRLLGSRDRARLRRRKFGVWRYVDWLPVRHPAKIISLGEGATPLIHLRRAGREMGLSRLYVKDEARNPTGTFKARGASVAVSRLSELGYRAFATDTVGSTGSAWSAYAARGGLRMYVGLPRLGVPPIGSIEAQAYGSAVTLWDGSINEAFGAFRGYAAGLDAIPVGAFREPYRLEGDKTIAYEIADQLGWKAPRAVLWPTGGGVGLAALGKAFDELDQLGLLGGNRPLLVSVQHTGCSPIADALNLGTVGVKGYEREVGIAPGIWAPYPPDGEAVLALARLCPTAGATVDDSSIVCTMKEVALKEGLLLSPEGAAAVATARILREAGALGADEIVVAVNTGAGLRYVELWASLLDRSRSGHLQ